MTASSSRPERRWIVLILLAHLLLSAGYSFLNPLGEAPDEADHWAYVVHLARERELPVGPQVTQSKHPPLYHLGAASAALLAEPTNDFLRSNPDVELTPRAGWSPNFFIHTSVESLPWEGGVAAFHLARLLTVLLSTLTVAATYALAKTAFPSRPLIALAGAGLLAGIPEFAFVGGAVSNDVPAALFGALALWGATAIYQNKGHIVPGWWTGPSLGLGLLTKTSTLGIWPAIGLLIVAGAIAGVAPKAKSPASWFRALLESWRRWLATGLLVALPALLIALPWFLRNWQLYGDPLGMSLVVQTIDMRTDPWSLTDTWWLLRGWFVSFWGKFGGAGHIPFPNWVYMLLLVFSGAALLGLAKAFLPKPAGLRDFDRWPLTSLVVAVAGVGVGMWRYSLVALGTDQGRLLFPAASAIVLLLAIGWLALASERYRAHICATIVVGSLGLGVAGLLAVLSPAFAPPADQQGITFPDRTVTFDQLALLGADLSENPILYWQSPRTTDMDYRAVLRVVAADGTLVWERRRSPGAGRYSTDLWPADYVMEDVYQIDWPEWAGAGEYLAEVGVEPFGGPLVPYDGSVEGHPFYPIGTIVRDESN